MTDQKDRPAANALGQSFGLIWGDLNNVPHELLDLVFNDPSSVCTHVRKHPDFIRAPNKKQASVLLERASRVFSIKQGKMSKRQICYFWRGLFASKEDTSAIAGYGAEELRRIGEKLFGERWQTSLANEIGCNVRQIRQWLAGERPMQPHHWWPIFGAVYLCRRALDDELQHIMETVS